LLNFSNRPQTDRQTDRQADNQNVAVTKVLPKFSRFTSTIDSEQNKPTKKHTLLKTCVNSDVQRNETGNITAISNHGFMTTEEDTKPLAHH